MTHCPLQPEPLELIRWIPLILDPWTLEGAFTVSDHFKKPEPVHYCSHSSLDTEPSHLIPSELVFDISRPSVKATGTHRLVPQPGIGWVCPSEAVSVTRNKNMMIFEMERPHQPGPIIRALDGPG